MEIAVATSIFADNNFDPFLTINYAKENQISAIQFYMSDGIQGHSAKIEEIKNLCKRAGIKMLWHSPLSLGSAAMNMPHCMILAQSFNPDDKKYCIFHFDENITVDAMIEDCQRLIDFGILPCIENFYFNKTRHGLVANMEKYLSFFDHVQQKGLEVLPVIDFPRLFVEQFTNFHPIMLSELLIQKFRQQKMIVHAIDSRLAQQNREDWCSVGKGIVDWTGIFEFLSEKKVYVEFTVLEYEDTKYISESKRNLESYKKGRIEK